MQMGPGGRGLRIQTRPYLAIQSFGQLGITEWGVL